MSMYSTDIYVSYDRKDWLVFSVKNILILKQKKFHLISVSLQPLINVFCNIICPSSIIARIADTKDGNIYIFLVVIF